MKASKILTILAAILLTIQTNFAQTSQALDFITYPNSIASFGMGSNSVALPFSADAMTFNPANLVYAKGVGISFFRQPFQVFIDAPISNYSTTFQYKDYGVFSFEYRNQDFGEFAITSANDPTPLGFYTSYYNNFGFAYARRLSEDLSVGAALKYSYYYFGENVADLISISFGLNYNFELLERKFKLGFSLMNLGPSIEFNYVNVRSGYATSNYNPPPSNLNFGAYAEPVRNDFYALGIQLAFLKPFNTKAGEEAASSFKTLFTGWSDFPNDAILNTGLAFTWEPLRLGENIYFWQEFYLGNRSAGSKSRKGNFYSHGGLIGIEYSGIKFTAGYAGYWHNVNFQNYGPWIFPYETFQFTLGLSEDYLFGNKNQKSSGDSFLERIVLSSGAGYSKKVGKYSQPIEIVTQKNGLSYYFEAAFYISKSSALISSVIYHPYDFDYTIPDWFSATMKFETFSVLSSFRYHPIDLFDELFVQTGIGIHRWNPVPNTTPKYDYKAIFVTAVGGEIEVYQNIVVIPTVDWFLTFDRATGSAPRMQGWNQFDFVLKLGYSFR